MSPGRGLRSRLAVEAYASSTRAGSRPWMMATISPPVMVSFSSR